MRRLALAFLLGAAAPAAAFADAHDWYSPAGQWYGGTVGRAKFSLDERRYDLTINADGSLAGDDWALIQSAFEGDDSAQLAIRAVCDALSAQVMAKNIANNLDNLALAYDDGTGVRQSVRVSPARSGVPSSNAQTVLKLPPRVDADEVTLSASSVGNGKIIGWKSVPPAGSCLIEGTGSGGYDFVADRTDEKSVSATVKPIDGVKTRTLRIRGWDDAEPCGDSLSQMLTDKSGVGPRQTHEVLCRYGGANGELHYVRLGDTLDLGGGAPVDGCSVTTNVADGAVSQGVASLYNWSAQKDYAIPYKYRSMLYWRTPDAWVDGASLEWAKDGSENMKFAVKGAKDYAGKHSKHYFGTSNDKSAALGWHELPNATTNRVEGDEATISTNPNIPGRQPDPDVKLLGLRGWNYGYSGAPLFVVNNGGAVDYIPLPALTNLAACACTQKWHSAMAWIGNGAEISDDGLTLPGESMDRFIRDTLGYVYSTTPANLRFDNDGDDLTASFGPPVNWADGKSVGMTSDKSGYEIKGWGSDGACSATISAMLNEPNGSDAQKHMLLARYADDNTLHYVPMGDGIAGGAALTIVGTDGNRVTVGSGSTTNTVTFASAKDSNVKVTVTGGGASVKVEIGVYYQ